jgi:hypothetical protein
MVNYASYDEETLKSDYGKLLTEIKGMSLNKVTKYSNDTAYYLIIKGDVTQRSKEYASESRDTVIKEMKNPDFEKLIEQWEEDIKIKVDNASIKKYSAKNIYKKYSDYSKNNKQAV